MPLCSSCIENVTVLGLTQGVCAGYDENGYGDQRKRSPTSLCLDAFELRRQATVRPSSTPILRPPMSITIRAPTQTPSTGWSRDECNQTTLVGRVGHPSQPRDRPPTPSSIGLWWAEWDTLVNRGTVRPHPRRLDTQRRRDKSMVRPEP